MTLERLQQIRSQAFTGGRIPSSAEMREICDLAMAYLETLAELKARAVNPPVAPDQRR